MKGLVLVLTTVASAAAAQSPPAPPGAPRGSPNELTAADSAAGWRLLFDGRTLRGWRGIGSDSVPSAHWRVEDGAIRKLASGAVPRRPDGQPVAGGDLMSVDSFTDFELTWEWRMSPGGNSGVKYNVSEQLSLTLGRAAVGFEYQLLDDDRHPDGALPSHRSGALYDMIAPNERKRLAPVGQWNSSAVILRGTHGEHWLNGERIVAFELGVPRMDSLLAASKYRPIPWFANRRAGHIVLQDHGDEVFFRTIRIRPLTGATR
jgi:hypothetical protein